MSISTGSITKVFSETQNWNKNPLIEWGFLSVS